MKLPLHIAMKLRQLKQPGATLAGSLMHHPVVEKMREDGILQKKVLGKTRSIYFLPNPSVLNDYLHNQFGIGNLERYIEKQAGDFITRAEAVEISGDSKLTRIRTFSGFLVNLLQPVLATLDGLPVTLQPLPGTFTFISDYTNFIPSPGVTIVGIENAENFSRLQQQAYLFASIQPLFVSRYPQSNDLVKWLKTIPNAYLHFGDLDFEGINIYLNEFKRHLGEKASFLVPPQTADLLALYGNRTLYNLQLTRAPQSESMTEPAIKQLIHLLHQTKKVLEQEIFIGLEK